MKDFSPKAASAYARLLAKYVDYDEIDNFQADFETFLDAYENGGDDAEIIHCDAKIAVNDVPVEKFLKREEPKAGEFYRDIFGEKYLVAAVNKTLPDEPVVVLIHMNKSGNPVDNAFITTLKEFMNPQFVKTA